MMFPVPANPCSFYLSNSRSGPHQKASLRRFLIFRLYVLMFHVFGSLFRHRAKEVTKMIHFPDYIFYININCYILPKKHFFNK